MNTEIKVKIENEYKNAGNIYYVRAELTVTGELNTSHEAREYWGANVYEIVHEWEPETAEIDFIDAEIWCDQLQDYKPCGADIPSDIKELITHDAMEEDYNG